MSTAARPKLQMHKELVVLEVANTSELRERLKDQTAQGLDLFQVVPHGTGFVIIFSKETPFRPS
jgi:hypothetical protein